MTSIIDMNGFTKCPNISININIIYTHAYIDTDKHIQSRTYTHALKHFRITSRSCDMSLYSPFETKEICLITFVTNSTCLFKGV